jgi:large subunit ribosomal protein L18e
MSEESDMKSKKTNPQLVDLILLLKKQSREHDAKIWRDIAERLQKPKRNWAEVNVSRLERYLNDNDTAVIAGKLLGAGTIGTPITVAAFQCSDSARRKIENAGGTVLTIPELVNLNTKGTGVRIMG